LDQLLVLVTLQRRFAIGVGQDKQELVTLYAIFSVVMPAKPFEKKQADRISIPKLKAKAFKMDVMTK
jgi:hypothetical protein